MKKHFFKIIVVLFIASLVFHAWVTIRLVERVSLHEAYIIKLVQTVAPQTP